MTKKTGSRSKKRSKTGKYVAGTSITIIALIVLIVAWPMMFPGAPIAVAGEDYSTFSITSSVDGEDVSDFVELDILVPDPDATFDSFEDYFDLGRFDTEVAGKNAEDITIDLTAFAVDGDWCWIVVDLDAETVFNTTYYLVSTASNDVFPMKAYHQPQDVQIDLLHIETGIHGVATSYGAAGNVNYQGTEAGLVRGNFTLTINTFGIDITDVEEEHRGAIGTAKWETTTTEYNELALDEQQEFYKMDNWCSLKGTYLPTNDTAKTYNSALSKMTVAYALEIVMNATIAAVSESADGLNITMSQDNRVDSTVLYLANTKAYIVFHEEVFAGDVFDFGYNTGINICMNATRIVMLYLPDVDGTAITATAFPFDITDGLPT